MEKKIPLERSENPAKSPKKIEIKPRQVIMYGQLGW